MPGTRLLTVTRSSASTPIPPRNTHAIPIARQPTANGGPSWPPPPRTLTPATRITRRIPTTRDCRPARSPHRGGRTFGPWRRRMSQLSRRTTTSFTIPVARRTPPKPTPSKARTSISTATASVLTLAWDRRRLVRRDAWPMPRAGAREARRREEGARGMARSRAGRVALIVVTLLAFAVGFVAVAAGLEITQPSQRGSAAHAQFEVGPGDNTAKVGARPPPTGPIPGGLVVRVLA